ncbi:MAG TPA: 2-oxoacid:acceptor oxidoreductase family protein [Planctomycetota bacterium]
MLNFSILVTGLGGQGILLVSKVIASACGRKYPFVCRTETRGLSQRGGSVISVVRFSSHAITPVIGPAGADLILSLDLLEAARALPFLNHHGRVLTNGEFVTPAGLLEQWRSTSGEKTNAQGLASQLASLVDSRSGTYRLPLLELAKEAGCGKGLNSVLLGAASHFLPVPSNDLRQTLLSSVKPGTSEQNAKAFDAGLGALAHGMHSSLQLPSPVSRAIA